MTDSPRARLAGLAAIGIGVAVNEATHKVGGPLLAALTASCLAVSFFAARRRSVPAPRRHDRADGAPLDGAPLALAGVTAAPGGLWTQRHVGAWRAVKSGLASRGDEGLATVEVVVLIPVLLAVIGLAVIGGRITTAEGQVQGAARAAARAASLQRDPTDAQAAADQAAQADLQSAGVNCASHTLRLVAGPPGGVDQVTLSCVIPLGGVEWMNVAASKTIVSSFSSPVDAYREGS